MKIQILSKSKSGKWVSILTLLFIFFMFLKFSKFMIKFSFPLPSLLIALLGFIGFIFGLFSFIKNKDKSLFVLLSITIGLIIIFWVSAEIMYPH